MKHKNKKWEQNIGNILNHKILKYEIGGIITTDEKYEYDKNMNSEYELGTRKRKTEQE